MHALDVSSTAGRFTRAVLAVHRKREREIERERERERENERERERKRERERRKRQGERARERERGREGERHAPLTARSIGDCRRWRTWRPSTFRTTRSSS
jgi:hypothetical protein